MQILTEAQLCHNECLNNGVRQWRRGQGVARLAEPLCLLCTHGTPPKRTLMSRRASPLGGWRDVCVVCGVSLSGVGVHLRLNWSLLPHWFDFSLACCEMFCHQHYFIHVFTFKYRLKFYVHENHPADHNLMFLSFPLGKFKGRGQMLAPGPCCRYCWPVPLASLLQDATAPAHHCSTDLSAWTSASPAE